MFFSISVNFALFLPFLNELFYKLSFYLVIFFKEVFELFIQILPVLLIQTLPLVTLSLARLYEEIRSIFACGRIRYPKPLKDRIQREKLEGEKTEGEKKGIFWTPNPLYVERKIGDNIIGGGMHMPPEQAEYLKNPKGF